MHKILREGLGGSTCPGSVGGARAPLAPPLASSLVATGVGEPLCGRMLLFDALSARVRIVCDFTL